MPEAKKRTYSGVYDALNKVSQEEGIDFGLENYSPEDFKKKYFTGPGNISNLYNKLSQISDEEGVDFGLGTQDEWLASFGYRRRGDNDYETLDGKRVGGKSQQQVMSDAQQTLGENQRVINRIGNRQQRVGLDTGPRVQIGGTGWQLGQNRKVTQGQQRFNPSTGQMEQTYITPSGNEYGTRGLADLEQNTIDQIDYDTSHPVDALSSRINSQIADLESKRESLMQSGMEQARQDLENKGGIRGAIDRFLAGKRDVGPFGPTRAYAEQAARNKELATIETALKDLRDARTRIERGKQLSVSSDFLGGIGVPFTKDWFNNWKNFGYGIWDTMDDVAFNFFGNKDIDKASAYLRIKDKMESGKELTDTETSLALAGMAKAQAEELVSLPHGYTAGETTLEMAPFMFQMAANPAGGMSRSLARQAVRQFGRNGLKAVTTRVLARGLGNLGEAAILSNTLQGGNTAADIAMRYSGDSFQFDDNGKLHMGYYEEGPDGKATFVDGGKSLLRSVYEGEASSIIENFTELGFGGNIGKAFGGLFSKAAASKLGSKIGLEYISGLVSKIGSTPFAKSMKSFMERTHWDGMIEEPLEEEYGIILNSFLGTGDAKISDLWDSEKQADIFAGTMWFGGFMAGMNTAAYPIYRHGIKKQLQQADQNAQIAFGDEWEVMKDGIDMMDDKEVAKYLYSIKDNDAFSKEQKAALFAYTTRLKQYQGAEVADMLSRMEGNVTEDNATIRTSYDAGYDTEEPDDMKMIVDEADAAREQLKQYGNEFSIMVENGSDNPGNTLDYLMEHRNIFSDEQIAAAADYYQKQAMALGVMDAQSDKVDLEVERANAEVISNTHQQSGNVVTATVNDEEVYVIGGEIVTDPNTGLTALTGTGGAVVVKNPVTGQVSVKSPQEVVVQSVQNADDLIQQNETTLRQQLVQQADDNITFGSPANEAYDMEDQVSFQDDNGNVVNGMVVQLPNAVDGAYIIQTDDNKILQMTADDLNRRIVAHNGMQVERTSAQPAQQPEGEGAAQPAEQQGGTLDNAGGEAGAENGTGADNPPATAISRIPVATDEKGQPILKKGRPQYLWHQVSVEDATDALIETTGGDKLMARDTAKDLIDVAREKLEKIRKQKPKGEDPIEIAESRMAIKQQETEQQAIIKQWQLVNQRIQNMMQEESAARQAAIEAAKSEEQRQREAEEARIAKERQDEQDRKRLREQIERDRERRNKEYEPLVQARKDMADDAEALAILADTEPRSLDEYVSSLLRPHSMLWLDASDSEIGLQTELGLKRNDMQRMMSLLGTKESGAKPFWQVMLDIHEGLPQGMKEMYTDTDVRNALLDLFNEGSSTRMLHLTEEHRIEEARSMYAENQRREAEAEMEAWAEAYHLTPEERETFEDYLQQQPSLPEQDIINQIIADNEQNRTSPAVGEQPVSGTAAGSIEGGEGQIQQAAEAAGNGDNAQAANQGAEAATGQPPVADNNVPGTARDREALAVLFDQIGASPILAGRMSDYDVEQLTAMVEDWEIANDAYGQVIEQKKSALKSKNKETREAAQKAIDDAQEQANAVFEPIEEYIEGLNVKYGIESDDVKYGIESKPFEGAIPTPQIDKPRYDANRQALIDAYKSGDPAAITQAAQAIQQYVDEGLDAGEDKTEMFDIAEEYDGNDPEKLADQYIIRTFWDRYLDDDTDQEYIKTGLKADMRQPAAEHKSIGKTSSAEEIAAQEAQVDTTPTEAQKEAGNYQKGHIMVDGYDITIENPKGSIRRGTDASGKQWEQEMHNTYGYIKGTEGVDGDHIDVFLSDNPASGKVWVVDQVNKDGSFDEHKVMYGFANVADATKAYLSNYEEGWQGLGSISGISREEFKKWIESSHRKTKPFRDYALAKSAEAKEKKSASKPAKEHKRIVSDEKMEDLRKQLLAKFNNMNEGIDVERMLLGAMYAVGKIERGVTKFADYAAQMVDEIGDAIRPYLKAFYNAVRDMPEAAPYRDQMDSAEYVDKFDVFNFDKQKQPTVFEKAEQVVKQQKAKKQVKKIIQEQPTLWDDMFAETESQPTEPKKEEPKQEPAKRKEPKLRPATEADLEGEHPIVYLNGHPWNIIAVMRSGEQISATKFSEPKVDSVVLTNGKSVKLSELMVEDKSDGKQQRKTAWWNDPNRPQSLDASDHRTYTTDEAKAYFAQFKSEDGKTDFTKWAHPNLAYITAAAWDGANIPKEELMQIAEIQEAENRVKEKENKEKFPKFRISKQERRELAARLLDDEHGSAVFENGKIKKVNDKEVFTGPVRQEKKAFVVVGRPAGDKSSVFANRLSHDNGARIVDSDVVKPWMSGYDEGYGAGYVQLASADVASSALKKASDAGDNIVLPRIGGDGVMNEVIMLREKGYDVQIFFNEVSEKTSIMRAASRFAQEGRYLSLDYLTHIKDKDSKSFRTFVGKKIGDYYEQVQTERTRPSDGSVSSSDVLAGRGNRPGNQEEGLRRGDFGRGGSSDVPGVVSETGRFGRAGQERPAGTFEEELIFSYAEWKSNDVAFGEKPKEIWNSNSGKPMPAIKTENDGVQSEQRLSGEPSSSGEGKREDRGAADGDRAGLGSEPNRTEHVRSEHSVTEQPAQPKQAPKHNNKRNNSGERGKDYAPTSPKARFNANVEAIKMMRELIDQGIEAPTKDQMEVLRQYSGWGGLGTYFNDETSAENKILRDLLDDEEYNDAVMSINSAYYTPATVIDTLWDVAKAMGFKGGNVLEGSAGIGNIIGQMPKDMSRQSNIEAVEIDKISGNILKLLYPDAKVHIQGFQDTVIRNGSVDLAVTNVPFVTGLHVIDKVDKDLSRRFVNIHDFCIAKNIRKLREGGIGIFITSSGTLDKSTDLRAWITDEGQADVVGAFRLNNETFGGTKVTSDIIVVRKRIGGVKSSAAINISQANPVKVGTYEDKFHNEHQSTMVINDYFKEHPEMMAGEMAFGYEKGDTFRPGSYGLYPVANMNQEKMLKNFVKTIGEHMKMAADLDELFDAVRSKAKKQDEEPNQLTAVKEGRMLVDDKGRICVSRLGEAVPLGLNDQKVKGQTKQQCFKDYQAVQAAVDDVLQQQLNDPNDEALKPKLAALNKAYDLFTKRYGTLHKNTAISFLRNDIDFPSFQALEIYKEEKDIKGNVKVITAKPKLFSERVVGFKTEPQPKTVKDAVIASIFRTNGIDLEWITSKLNEVAAPPHGDQWTTDDVRKGILVSRLGFEDPSTGQLEIRYKYLSGNVREKLAIAEQYNAEGETAGRYAANVEELKKVVPMDIPAHLIDFSLGSSWIPVDLYKDFVKETLDLGNVRITHLEGSWAFDEGYSYRNEKNRSAGVYSEKFRETIYGHQLVAAALNNRPVKVAKVVKDGYGSNASSHTEVDQAATQACAVRVDEIKEEFKQWAKKKMQEDPELARRIEKLYNEKFNALVPMEVGEEFLPERFEGANTGITLRPHQKLGAIKGLVAPTMLAHEVGTGKSFTLITTAMEMRRLGTAKKPMIVVQNATVAQMTADTKLLYPNAKVLSLSEQDRDAEGRRAFYAKIKYNDWDIIIVPQSTFERIPDSPERELQFIQEKIDEKKHVIEAAQAAGVDSRELQKLKKELEKIEQEYGDVYLDKAPDNQQGKKKKKDAKREAASLDKARTKAKEQLDRAVDDVQYFDDLGVDALLVDEAHEYKHLGFQTSMGRGIKGIDPSYSKKCAGLYNKTRSVFEKAGWKNVVFATGTPISNTAAEIWTFMKYLMPADVMKANDIYYFDDFVHNFGSISQMLEFATNGKFKENTRFAAYVNKPELIRIWSQVADTVLSRETEVQDKIPELEGGKDQDVFLPQSPSLIRIMAAVRAELERFENMSGQEKKENSSIPLTMYGIAKRAAIDPRLVDAGAPDEPLSKTNAAVKEIVKDLKATQDYKGTVAVFCDNQNRLGYDDNSKLVASAYGRSQEDKALKKFGKRIVEFNIYDDMKAKLVKAGVPEKQIAIIKSGMSITAKQKIFDAVNSGDIRVVLGSTQTLGTGVNMQERLHLLIHMDAPDRPMDYTQRNGRIKRQGNLHKNWGKTIRVIRFGVEDSLDVTAYQRLKTKSGFIDSIMDGKAALANNQVDRTVEEEEEGLFDNPVAVLSGSQYALKKNQAERELRKYQGKKAQWEADQIYVTNQLRHNANEIGAYKAHIEDEQKTLDKIKSMFPDGTVKTITVEGVKIDMTKDDGAKKLGEVLKEKINDPVNAIVKRNRENAFYNDETLLYTISLDGHDVKFTVKVERESVWDNGRMKTVIHKYTSYSWPELNLDSIESARGVRDYLDELLDEVVTGRDSQDRIDAMKQRIERVNAETEQIQKRVGMPFQYDKELAEAQKNVEEYTELMKKEMKEKEAKYAAQQKEAEAGSKGFDLSKAEDSEDEDNIRYRDAEDWYEPVFYSNAEMAVEGIRQEKATPEQWLAMIQKAGGIKAGEDKWLGLSDWLINNEKRTLTKQEVLGFIKANQIEVQEEHYQEQEEMDSILDGIYEMEGLEFRDEFADAFEIYDGDLTIRDEEAAIRLYNRENVYQSPLDWDGYVIDEDTEDTLLEWAQDVVDRANTRTKEINQTRLRYTTAGLENKREIALTVPSIQPYRQDDDIHFGDAGGGRAVAWVRFGEISMNDAGAVYDNHDSFILAMQRKYDAEGPALRKKMTDEEKRQEDELLAGVKPNTQKTRVLVIDEIQSKRHQDGREKGYGVPAFRKATIGEYKPTDEETEYEADIIAPNGNKIGIMTRFEYEGEDVSYSAMNNDGTHMTSARPTEQEALDAMDNLNPKGVPDAPFEKNWQELAMKRMLRYAAENGYDKIAWTTGEQQAERYNIGNVVEKIISYDYPEVNDSDGRKTKKIEVRLKNGETMTMRVAQNGMVIEGRSDTDGKNLADVVGKDLAKRIMGGEGKYGTIFDANKDLPAKVIEGDGLRIGAEGMKGFYDEMLVRFMNKYGKKWGVQVSQTELPGINKTMWSIDVTPEMKTSVMLGQPMFRDADVFTEGESFPINTTLGYSSFNVLGTSATYSTDLMPDAYTSHEEMLDAIRRQYPAYYARIEDGQVVMESWQHVFGAADAARQRKDKGSKSYVERKTRNAINAVQSLAKQMHLDVDVLTTTDGLEGKKARAKGWFNRKTGKITLVLPNHSSQGDLINTLLHEGVAHYGLRNMFGQHFDTFLDNVYNNVSPEIKARIDAAMKRNKWSRHEATEEYLARLAERTDFDNATRQGWWQKIKEFFMNMLANVGLVMDDPLTDNELRYILWRSYDNLLHPDSMRNIFDKAREVQMQSRLRVGPYSERERQRIQRTGRVDTSRIAFAADRVNEEMLNPDFEGKSSQELLLSLSQKDENGRNETINELVRRVREGEARIVRMGQEVGSERANDAQIAGTILGGWQQLRLSEPSDDVLGGMVQSSSPVEGRQVSTGENTSPNSKLAIISWARATGHYISEEQVKKASLDKDVWRAAAESRVYRTSDGKKVIKFTETYSYYENPLLKRMDGIALHNAAGFEPITVLGYAEDSKGHLLTVVEQDYVDGVTIDDIFDDEPLIKVNNYLDDFIEEELGLIRHMDAEGNLFHMKDGIIYKDIHGGNVIVDKNNKHHVIDCYVSRDGDDQKERADGFSIEDENIRYSIRTKEAPKKTGTGYKVFVLKDGELYPPMVANPNGEGTPLGVWLDADAAPVAGTSKTGRPQVKAGGKGTQGGSGQLAYRPGWHLGTIPYALQFGRKDANGERTLFPNNFVWAEVEYADDVDYQDEARQEGVNANGKYQHSLAGLKHVPTDGSYKYRTNPDPRTDEWVITGAMRVKKILTRAEVDELVRKAGREPQQIQDGDIVIDDVVKELNDEIKATMEADEMGLLYRDDDAWVDDVAKDAYEKAVAQKGVKLKEAWQDSMVALKLIQNAIAKETGRVATGAEDAYNFENRMHGRAKNMTEQYDWNFYRPMLKAFADFCKEHDYTQEKGLEYLISKSGLERNMYYAMQAAVKDKLAEDAKKQREQLEKDYAKGRIPEQHYKDRKAEIEDLENNGVDDAIKDIKDKYLWKKAQDDYDNGRIDYGEMLRRREMVIASVAPKYTEYAHDYSGLTETFAKKMYDSAQAIKKEAQRAIDPQERRMLWREYDEAMRQAYETAREKALDAVFSGENGDFKEASNQLWATINAATEETLKFNYESGLMDRKTYNKVREMFDYYIPLRGWDEDKASDVYTYMGKDNVFSPAVKKTWGRTSKAENPLAYIGNIAVSTIIAGHRNLMKQHFLNYVMNNPTSLVSISESWYENIGSEDDHPVWILRSADTAGKSGDELAQIVNDFNEEMRQKQREGKAMPVRGRLRLDVHATSGQKNEHVVEVQRAGRTYQLYINGDPKAAQALNGTAARAVSRISDTWLGKKITKLNRNMAMFFTSKNPAFVVSNLSRDLNVAGASVAINEGAKYNGQFVANVIKVLAPRIGESSKWMPASKQPTGLMPSLMRKWQNGTLDESNETERLFKEFMTEGGETGFVNMLSIDSFKEKMQKEIREMNGSSLTGAKGAKETSIHKGLRLLGDTFEFYNRCAEDATRFIVYMTSRQMGKTMEESIADAKNVTLNFNRKGTGAMGNAEVRDLFIFVNPAIQALANMYRMAKGHPLKFGAVTAAFVAGGALMPIINQWLINMFGNDDDKDSYWNLPPWVRKNNLVFWVPGTKVFVTIPLSQEFRVFYGIGEMVSSLAMEHPVNSWGLELFSSVADLVPINPTGNGGNLLVDFAPTMVQPIMQIGENVDFTGKPIWRDNQGNKYDPMFAKAYVSTPKWMTKISEGINYATGGDQDSRGWLERTTPGAYLNNPAVWNHLLQGYFGGMYNTIAKTFDVTATAASGEMPKIYQTPVINRFLNRPVERDNAGALGEDYWQLVNEMEETQHNITAKRKRAADGDENAKIQAEELMESSDGKRADVIRHYKSIIDELRKGERSSSDKEEKKQFKESIAMYKQQMLEELQAIDAGVDPLEAAMQQFDKATKLEERKKLQNRINRLTSDKNRTKGASADVEKAKRYLDSESDEPGKAADYYLKLATSAEIKADARIKAAKARIKVYADHLKQLETNGKGEEVNAYRKANAQWLAADAIIKNQSRLMSRNKKMLGKGYDKQVMRLIANNRNAMLKAIDNLPSE